MGDIRIGGIKKSLELTLLRIKGLRETQPLLSRTCRILAKARINAAFLTVTLVPSGAGISCCVSTLDGYRAVSAMEADALLQNRVETVSDVGLLSVFPARRSLPILGQSLAALARAEAPVHGIGSSLSTYTFVIGYERMVPAVRELALAFGLPPDYRAAEPEFRVLQSSLTREED